MTFERLDILGLNDLSVWGGRMLSFKSSKKRLANDQLFSKWRTCGNKSKFCRSFSSVNVLLMCCHPCDCQYMCFLSVLMVILAVLFRIVPGHETYILSLVETYNLFCLCDMWRVSLGAGSRVQFYRGGRLGNCYSWGGHWET